MASLSNINGLFDVHSTGAILFSTSHGTSGQILKSNGNAAPTWIPQSDIVGDYLPLAGGTLTGNLALTDATNNPSLVISTGTLTVGGVTALNASTTIIRDSSGYALRLDSANATTDNDLRFAKGGVDYAAIQVAGPATSDFEFYVNDGTSWINTLTFARADGQAVFTKLVSGITPTAAANFATKAYVDAHPGSGGTVTGTGTNDYIPRWNAAGTGIENSLLIDTGALSYTTSQSVILNLKGTSAPGYAEINIKNDVNNFINIGSIGSTYSGADWAGSTYVYNTGTGRKMYIKSQDELRLLTGGTSLSSNTALTIDTSQNATFTGLVSGITPTANANFATKAYVDAHPDGTVKGTGTATRVAFWSASDTLSSDANLYWDNTNNRLGIGTASPGAQLHNYSTAATNVFITGHGTAAQNDWGAQNCMFVKTDNGLLISKANAANNTNRIFNFYNDANGYAQLYMHAGATAYVKIQASGNSYFNGGNVGIGTTSPTQRLQLGVNGSLIDSIRIGNYAVAKNTRQYIGYTRADSGLFETTGNGDTPSTVLAGVAGVRIVNTTGTLASSQADNSVQLLTHIYNGGSRVALHASYNGNVGIGTISPNEKLQVAGNIHAYAPSGIDAVLFASTAAGSTTIAIRSSGITHFNGGNVGIGTTSPGVKLEIAETAASTDCIVRIKATRDAYLQFSPANTTKWGLIADYPALGDFTTYNYPNNFNAIVCKDNKDITTNLSGGNVGIGVTSPGHKLEVNGGIRAGIAGNSSANTPGLKVYAASAQTDTTAAIAIQQGTNEGDTIIFADYEPHVEWGISAQNSTDQIHFTSGSSTNSLGSKTFYNNAGAARTAYIKFNHSLGDGRTLIGGNLGLGVTSATERLVVAGKVMINNAIAPNNLAQLNIGSTGSGETRAIDIDGSWSGNESKSITFTYGSSSTTMVGQINCQHNSPGSRIRWGKLYHSGNSSTYTMELISSSQTTANLTVAGNITAAADVVAYSDERLKSNIKTLDGSKVLKMRGVSFDKDGKKGSGVIAQELEKVAPELVHNKLEYKGVAYGNLVGYLIEAIKELEARVKELENK